MRLFFKHLLRDALRFPLQVLLILLTVTLSVSVSVTALKTYGMFKERAAWIEAGDTRLGDLLITPGASDMRALFDSDVDSMLGENDKMLGEFRLSAFPENASDHSVLSISAVDLVEADRYFEFIYTEYSTFTEENLKSSAVLSKSAAQRLGKSVGDSIDISFAGIELTYTVRAIAEDHGLLEERDMLVPISSLQSLLSEKIPSLAAFGNAFLPYTQIMIRLADKTDADALAKKITR